VGLPLKEYFIWLDDVEFTRRLAERKYGLVVLAAVVVHDVDPDWHVDWSRINADNVWKYCYGARNEASWRLHREGFRSFFWFLRQLHAQMRAGRVAPSCRRAVYFAALKAFGFDPQPDMPD
jgi:GT2 family glycosyltransferase